MLSSCKEALDRFECRHNNVVKYLHTLFSSQRLEDVEVYADLDGHRVNGVTTPLDLAMSAQKPDLNLVELTVPWDTSKNMASALQRKTTRYENLVAEIKGNGYKCSNIPLEIATRGVVNSRNRAVLTKLCHWMNVAKVSQVTKKCSKLALLGSYTIWNARHSLDWSSGGYLNF